MTAFHRLPERTPGMSWYVMFCHVPLIFLFCIARIDPSFRSRSCRQGTRGRHEMSCFVMVRGAACLSVPGLSCIVPPSRSPPPGGGTLFRAYRVCAGGRIGAGAVCAPDCACTRPRAHDPGHRAHVSRRFLRDLFLAPARADAARGCRLVTTYIGKTVPESMLL